MARVLVVDDEKLIVKGIRFSLEQDGMEVDCAYDGEEAIELAKKTEYDIVLLDVMLPKYDGYEVCQGNVADANHCDAGLLCHLDGLFHGQHRRHISAAVVPFKDSGTRSCLPPLKLRINRDAALGNPLAVILHAHSPVGVITPFVRPGEDISRHIRMIRLQPRLHQLIFH